MPRERNPDHIPVVPARVKVAIQFLTENRDDLHAAAQYAGIHIHELRRSLSKPHVITYARAMKKLAVEALCLSSPAHLADILKGDNAMAKCKAVQVAESLRLDAVELEQRATQRAPGLQIVIMQSSGEKTVAYSPTQLLEVEIAPAPEAVPVPATRPDVEAE